MHSPLLCINLILRYQTLGLQDVGPIIADFLGPSRSLSLHEACHYSSTKLLQWMWTSGRSAAADCNDSNWSLSRYLHSDVHYYQWQFSEALEVAVSRGDFEIVKWLFERFEACEVAVEVVETAAKDGLLEILQFLLKHDAGGEKKDVKSGDHCIQTKTKDSEQLTHLVHWGGRSLVKAVENGHATVARWLWQRSPGGYGEADTANAIRAALRVGDMKLAELLLPQDKRVLDYAEFCSHPDVIEWQLDCGYLQRDGLRSAIAIKELVRSGRLDLMKRIAAQNDPPPEGSDWRAEWRTAMVHACVHGDRSILQWLMEHPAGCWTCVGDERLYSELVFSAAYKGNVEVMEYLFERGATDKVRDGLLHAIREGHFDMVKWLVEHFPESERIPDYCVLDEAARYGRLEMLEYFQALQPSTVPGYSPVAVSPSRRAARNSREETFKMFVPASDDYLKIHQALCRYRTEWFATEPMNDAAANGHLEVVKWLHLNRSEGCTTAAMDCAAANGHLDIVRWLNTNRREGCTTKAVDGAAENGHLEVVKWLYRHQFMGCSRKAIDGALSNGHLRVANWLLAHFPSLTPHTVDLWRSPRSMFELLLFRSFHLGLGPGLQYAKRVLMDNLPDRGAKANQKHIIAWLKDNCPVPEVEELDEEEEWWQ